MKAIKLLLTVIVAVMFSFCNGTAAKKENQRVDNNAFAVVELFTSEGCSSCPAADDVMIRLAKEFPDHVYFLGYHVDYWDYIGWKDQFDDPAFTKRQNKYAETFRLESIYTPQSIINGKKELVGSRESELRTAIQQELKQSSSGDIQLTAKKTNGNGVTVTYKIPTPGTAILNIALVQLTATSNVKRGENNGRQLNHINIVRAFKTGLVNKGGTGSVDLAIPGGLDTKGVKIIAFLQKETDMKIVGATDALIH